MTTGLGPMLRMLGLLVEAACVLMIFSMRGQGRQVAGLPLEYLLYAGLAAGFVTWAVGMTMVRLAARRPRD
jgi:hypothetical protein